MDKTNWETIVLLNFYMEIMSSYFENVHDVEAGQYCLKNDLPQAN